MDPNISENNPQDKHFSRKCSNSYTHETNIIATNSDSNHDLDSLLETGTPKHDDGLKESSVEVEGVHQEIDNIGTNNESLPPETIFGDVDQFLSTLSEQENPSEGNDAGLEKAEKEEIPIFIENFLDLVSEKIDTHESSDGKVKWCNEPEGDSSFLEAVNRISKLTNSFSKLKSDPTHCALVNRIGVIQQRAMSYLEDEFRLLLEDYKTNVGSAQDHNRDGESSEMPVTESEESVDDEEDSFLGYSDEVIAILNKISKEMIEGGFESECCQVYMITRRHAFDECLNKVGFKKMSIDEVQKMQWEALEREIPAWINTFKECSNRYFPKEHKLAEAVFADNPSISSFLFSNLIRGVMIQLLNFTEGIAMTSCSAEKLFKFLDMYEILRDSIPAMDGLFTEQCENELKPEMITAKCRIGEAAISIFCDLENSIRSDSGKTTVPGGAVHPLTRYMVNYLKLSGEYIATLEQVFNEHSKIESESQDSHSNNGTESENDHSLFSVQLVRLMDLLDSNLEAKSKHYKDIGLGNIFMMNNVHYIYDKIKSSSEIHQVLGNTWSRKKSSDIRNYHKNYQREAWSKLLSCLAQDGLQVNGKVQKPVLKERCKNFYMMFDEIHRTQSSWVVKDGQLQSELRVSVSAIVIPAYRAFLGRFSQYLDPGRQYEKYIKYQPEDIENCIDQLFEGKPITSR
ncbi:exocyst complex component EXO70B1 [Mercurialis annua]|uniref:exocyst complex component EXO70B1 n=1 Tax=Mercurialis annua TaxID=3986 RepID=UPI0021608124|nr:exocyst complex component EXO70B1 [Mercurialis annua]